MRKEKIRLTVVFLGLTILSLATSSFDGWIGDRFALIRSGFSVPSDWLSSSDRLSRLELLNRVLYHVKESYVDPSRIVPKTMFQKALERTAEIVPEVRVLNPRANRSVLLVDEERKEFDSNLPTLYALHGAVSDALKFVRAHKRSDVSDADLELAAISGILSTLDPHSVYLPQDLYAETKVGTSGKFGGLGIVIGIRENKLTVIAPLDDTPAFRAGLKAGDTIAKIGDESTINMTLTEAVEKMRGPKGVPVTISILREGWTVARDFTIVRDIIKIVSVESDLLEGKIGYLQLKSFQGNTSRDLSRHLSELAAQAGGKLSGLILDLRNNPGGLLDQAVAVADKFLKDGVIVTTVGVANTVREQEKATEADTEPNYPLAVLVNAGSASASEIVAGALKYRDRAIVLGERTFGKGTVQSIFDLPEKSALKLTIAQYLTPGNRSIQSIGILPDVEIVPAIVADDRLDIFPSQDKAGEAELERHFEIPTPNEKPEPPQIQLRYLDTRTEKSLEEENLRSPEGSPGDRHQKLLKDYPIQTALALLRAAPPEADRPQLLKEVKKLSASLEAEQSKKIAASLSTRNIDWSPARGKGSKSCPALVPTVSVLPPPKIAVSAGDSFRLIATLENPGNCTYYQTWAESDSKNYLFKAREFLFGKVPPKTKISREAKIEVPKSMPTNLAAVKLTFHEAQDRTPKPLDYAVPIQSLPGPTFAFSYDIFDAPGPNSRGNGDGKIGVGEKIELKVNVSNVGEGTSSEGVVTIKNVKDQPALLYTGRTNLPVLKKGEMKQVSLSFEVLPSFHEDALKLDLAATDTVFRTQTAKRIVLPVAPTQGKAATATPRNLRPPVIQTDAEKLAFQPSPGKFIRLEGQLSDDGAMKDFYVMVNNRKVHYQSYEKANGKDHHAFNVTIPLEAGLNRILLVARDRDDLAGRVSFFIQRPESEEKGTDADQLQYAHDASMIDPNFEPTAE